MILDLHRKLHLELSMSFLGSYGLKVQIVSQRGFSKQNSNICEHEGLSIRVYNRPELTDTSLYLNGSDTSVELEPVTFMFSSQSKRNQMYDFLMEAQHVINGTHPTGEFRIGDCFYFDGIMFEIQSGDHLAIHGSSALINNMKTVLPGLYDSVLKAGQKIPKSKILKYTGNLAA